MALSLIAAALTFTATATGVEKGTAVEFLFVGRNSDRDYEAMFVLDETVSALCRRLEDAGLPRGFPTDPAFCRLWPCGCPVTFDPSLDGFVSGKMPEGLPPLVFVYTGGTRSAKGSCVADDEMPASFCSYYTLDQSPLVSNGICNQGVVYGSFKAAVTLKKGTKLTFTVRWDESLLPKHFDLTVLPGKAVEILELLRKESAERELDVTIGFDDQLSVKEATAVAQALSTIDSQRIKINGVSNLFYRAFLPLVKWQDRKERLSQPFEFTLGNPNRLVFIDEDWTVDGVDPKLTPVEITVADIARHPRTDTCFIYADAKTTVSEILRTMESLKGGNIRNWYVFSR